MIHRKLTEHLTCLATQFSAVAVTGPRQSGKTTLVKKTFPHYVYISLEDLDRRALAQEDPRGFLAAYANYPGMIIDEAQEVPALLSYMQGVIDELYKPGFFILTGSQNFLMHEKITQTLAGRIALLTLLPLSIQELSEANKTPENPSSVILKGLYPQVQTQNIDSRTWCNNYISTYVERDVRQLLNIVDVLTFQRFLKLCAARSGSQLNYAELARDTDVSPNTIKQWISILQASYIITLLPPYYKNFNKRVTKQPKFYFYDTALACALLGIKTQDDLFTHPLREALFETFIISDIVKYYYNTELTQHDQSSLLMV